MKGIWGLRKRRGVALAPVFAPQAAVERAGLMKVEVAYFAQIREAAGTQRESLRLPVGSSTGDLVSSAIRMHRRLGGLEKITRVVVNGELVNASLVLHDGDKIALLPPSCGG